MGAEKFTEGFRFDRYEIGGLLGEGGMGSVWRATHLKLQKPVVIKTLRPEHARSETTRSRFVREGEAAARIRHPNVVEIFDVAEFEGSPYLVMEFLDGEDLRAFLRRKGALPLEVIADVMFPVCSVVAAAHDAGVVHRDLKPENIFLSRTRDGAIVPKVLDFGISRMHDVDTQNRTATGALLGTPRYMSPEQARGDRDLDARSDQYALGVILYECATGRVPVDEGALYEVLRRTIHGDFKRPSAHRADLPLAFEAMVMRALALRPEERFPTVRALAHALLSFGDDRVRARHSVTAAPTYDTFSGAIPSATPDSGTLGDTGVEVDTVPDRRAASLRRAAIAAAGLACVLAAAFWVRSHREPTATRTSAVSAQPSSIARVEATQVVIPPEPHVAQPPTEPPATPTITADAGAVTSPAARAATRPRSALPPAQRVGTRTPQAPASPRTTSGLAID